MDMLRTRVCQWLGTLRPYSDAWDIFRDLPMFPVKDICLQPGSRCGVALEAVGLPALLAPFLDKAGSLCHEQPK